MFGFGKPQCPLDFDEKVWIERRMAWLANSFGVERMLKAPVIEPTAEFFPDVYRGTDEDVEKILDRLCVFMGIERERLRLDFFDEADRDPRGPKGEGHSSRALGTYHQEDDGRPVIRVSRDAMHDPFVVCSTLSHELCHELLLGEKRLG